MATTASERTKAVTRVSVAGSLDQDERVDLLQVRLLRKHGGGEFALKRRKFHGAAGVPGQDELHGPIAEPAEPVVQQDLHPTHLPKTQRPAMLWASAGTVVLAD